MGRDAPPGSAGVPPAYSAVASRSVSLRCSTRLPCRRERRRPDCAETNAGEMPALQGGFRPQRYRCKQPDSQDHSLAGRTRVGIAP